MVDSVPVELGFVPHWPVPANVHCFISYRSGGVSLGPYASNNLAAHVGDDEKAVENNRRFLRETLQLPNSPLWMTQVHGKCVVDAGSPQGVEADGSISKQVGNVCAVLTADCLPILLCDRVGRQVAAVHGGWRGLAGGIIAEAICQFAGSPTELMAFLGPAISANVYEVGQEVVGAFAGLPGDVSDYAKVNGEKPDRYFLDLYSVAKLQLHALGVTAVYGGDRCSYTEKDFFYSYRRDGQCGRMASLIWLL